MRERVKKNPLLLLSALQKNQTGLHVSVGVNERTNERLRGRGAHGIRTRWTRGGGKVVKE